jgi:hypothetical protein
MEKLIPICPKCGTQGKCTHHGDVSAGTRYLDRYTFECKACGFTDQKFMEGGDSGWMNWPTNCPFCNL